jgi:osmotically-inducible protein OsmY
MQRLRFFTRVVLPAVALAALAGFAVAGDNDVAKREQALAKLLVDKLGADAKTIRVVIDGGKVLLLGTVAERSTQELAKEVLLSAGVDKLTNKLKAKNEKKIGQGNALQEIEDARLEAQVKSKIGDEIGDHAKAIEVEVVDGVVSLRGELPDAVRRGFAIDAAKGTEGVKKVIDLIAVKS